MINKVFKFIKEHQILILGFAISLQLFFLILNWKSKDTGLSQTKELIAAKDETIRSIQRERDVYREWKDSTIATLNSRNNQLEKEYTKTNIKYDKVPIYIISLSKDSLRAEGERTARQN